jgi:hypothetical protein
MKAGGGVWWPMTGRGWCFSGNGDQPRVVLGVPTLVGAVTTFQGIRCTQRAHTDWAGKCKARKRRKQLLVTVLGNVDDSWVITHGS